MPDLSTTIAALRAGEQSVAAFLEPFLQEVAAREDAVHAWAYFDAERLRAHAERLDALEPAARTGALFGMPIAVKDIFDTADWPTAYGSPIYADHQPRVDAACVAALKRSGAIIMGKTATTEFAALNPAATVNPHDPGRTPGGSSSGSAAAVASGMAPAALGTQTVGSIVRPASFCGVVGYKPTFNLVNRAGLKPLSESTDTIGLLAESVDAAARVVAVMAGRQALAEPVRVGRNLGIALVKTPAWDAADDAGHVALFEAGERLRAGGAQVEEVALPEACEGLGPAGLKIFVRDAAAALAYERNVAFDQLSAIMQDLVASGLDVDAAAYDEAHALAAQCRTLVEDAVFADHDVVLALSAPGEAPIGLATTGSPVFNHLWTLLHMPCVSIPGLRGPASMPIGVQLVGRRGSDPTLLAVAAWAESVLSD